MNPLFEGVGGVILLLWRGWRGLIPALCGVSKMEREFRQQVLFLLLRIRYKFCNFANSILSLFDI